MSVTASRPIYLVMALIYYVYILLGRAKVLCICTLTRSIFCIAGRIHSMPILTSLADSAVLNPIIKLKYTVPCTIRVFVSLNKNIYYLLVQSYLILLHQYKSASFPKTVIWLISTKRIGVTVSYHRKCGSRGSLNDLELFKPAKCAELGRIAVAKTSRARTALVGKFGIRSNYNVDVRMQSMTWNAYILASVVTREPDPQGRCLRLYRNFTIS